MAFANMYYLCVLYWVCVACMVHAVTGALCVNVMYARERLAEREVETTTTTTILAISSTTSIPTTTPTTNTSSATSTAAPCTDTNRVLIVAAVCLAAIAVIIAFLGSVALLSRLGKYSVCMTDWCRHNLARKLSTSYDTAEHGVVVSMKTLQDTKQS
jgi:uncharacterized membrane protein